MGVEEIAALAGVIRSHWLGMGPKVAEFERRFAAYVDLPHAVGLTSATAALDLACRLLDLKPGDEVIVPTITFVSTAHAVCYSGATPVFADVDPKTLGISIADVEAKLTTRTRAILPVHYGGRPVDMVTLQWTARSIPLIEDCAHACGARLLGKPVGGWGRMGCFSFHAVKNLAMGDGGALVLHDPDLASRARRLRWLGIDKSTWDRADAGGYQWEYDVPEIGLKCHMNDLQAALGLVQLERLEANNARRRALVERYRENLAGISGLFLPPQDDGVYRSAWHLFWIRCPKRDQLGHYLQERGITTGVHYKPIHLYRCYGPQPSLPMAEQLQHEILSLPLYPSLEGAEVDRICDLIGRFYRCA